MREKVQRAKLEVSGAVRRAEPQHDIDARCQDAPAAHSVDE